MSEITLLYVMAAFVIVAAIALCIQAGMLAGIYKTTKSLQEKIDPLVPKVESLVERANSTVEQSGRQIAEITTRANAILESSKEIVDSTKRQLAMVEEVVGDATARAKVQMERVELVLDTLSRAHETVAVVHDGIMRPLREVNGIAAGVRAALGALARGNRPTVDRATSDEEMFI
jgi:methyl-accepting chemotaxis protein